MKVKNIFNKVLVGSVLVASAFTTSCVNDLDTTPIDDRIEVSDNVYKDADNYIKVLGKVYGNLALSGQKGPAGDGDIQGIDEGHGQYLRGLFYATEYPTDEANNCWQNEYDLSFGYTTLSYAASNTYVSALYSRIFLGISYANEFLRETTDEKLSARGLSADAAFVSQVKQYRAEARFLRALSYWHAIDLFGNIPFVTEADPVGSFNPPQKKKAEVFQFIVDELLEVTDGSGDEKLLEQAPYGTAGKYAGYMLLSKLYLNKNVYTFDYDNSSTIPDRYPSGTAADYTEAAKYAKLVIDNGGYSLNADYTANFRADNHLSDEIIFSIPCDGRSTQSWGAMTFILSGSLWTDWSGLETNYGTSGAWGGHRTTEEFAAKFATTDSRALFNRELMRPENDDIFDFKSGVGIVKYKNLTTDGTIGSDKSFPDIDFPMFRLSDAMLMYAEAVKRGGTGDLTVATGYINDIRQRSGQGDIGTNWAIEDVIDERARELYWECHRRTDLIRFGLLTSSEYVWPYKGNSEAGTSVRSYKNLFPIPADEIGANPTLEQNPGY
ncbi:RagB/SusD family nutrient uptake outer membrane protein [Flammeovirga agarivorans]|uniref:RagB/SusD family nutrient uptake outer membrane protein n=1 Tax=Flammeovirga agarivorans TaxID=2726742 RepID=A0A7X8XYH2_9BACT|nr:RagB/SusD family nutrient uptake outer membrane protein [Flammeovirga agarivorans]NLR94113.1 RagB/SusD family nutrient uptake outer membrane protein [Flammeovirga agarivorans]